MKGKLYLGNTGVGKTTRLRKEFDERAGDFKAWIDADDIFELGLTAGLVELKAKVRQKHLYIDDIGHEPTSCSHFGTSFSPVTEVIKLRYKMFSDPVEGKYLPTLHATTNLTPDELVLKYGAYIVDRLVEMCEWNNLEGQSWRR